MTRNLEASTIAADMVNQFRAMLHTGRFTTEQLAQDPNMQGLEAIGIMPQAVNDFLRMISKKAEEHPDTKDMDVARAMLNGLVNQEFHGIYDEGIRGRRALIISSLATRKERYEPDDEFSSVGEVHEYLQTADGQEMLGDVLRRAVGLDIEDINGIEASFANVDPTIPSIMVVDKVTESDRGVWLRNNVLRPAGTKLSQQNAPLPDATSTVRL